MIAIELQLDREKVLICNCHRPPHKGVIEFCADIESVIKNATPEFKSFIFLGEIVEILSFGLKIRLQLKVEQLKQCLIHFYLISSSTSQPALWVLATHALIIYLLITTISYQKWESGLKLPVITVLSMLV